MWRLASCALLVALASAAAGCASARVAVGSGRLVARPVSETGPAARIGPGPFALGGGWVGGGGSGLWGDGGSGPHGTSLGCFDNRHYSYAFGVKNTLKSPVTLTAAIGPNPAPRIVDRVATQLTLSPRQRRLRRGVNYGLGGSVGMDLVYHHWSAAPTKPVTVPPHRIATIQVDFVMHDCDRLRSRRSITVPGSLVLRYRTFGKSHHQKLALPENRFVVTAGPLRRTCTPVAGSGSLRTADVRCAFARRAATACRAMHNGGWLGCTIDGRYWECGRFDGLGYPLLETCYLPHEKSHWFSVVWISHGLGLWGAIADRRVGLGLNGRATRGICAYRAADTLVFESRALRILHSNDHARVSADARVRFVVRGFGGPGHFLTNGSTGHGGSAVEVLIGHGATKPSFVATAGRLTIVHATARSVSGTVYSTLRRPTGKSQASLNGTWSCDLGTG